MAVLLAPPVHPAMVIPVAAARKAPKSAYDHASSAGRGPRGAVTTSTRPSVFTPGGGVLVTRET